MSNLLQDPGVLNYCMHVFPEKTVGNNYFG